MELYIALGTALGTALANALGFELGKKLGAPLGSRLGTELRAALGERTWLETRIRNRYSTTDRTRDSGSLSLFVDGLIALYNLIGIDSFIYSSTHPFARILTIAFGLTVLCVLCCVK